jgi:hypothetical protein
MSRLLKKRRHHPQNRGMGCFVSIEQSKKKYEVRTSEYLSEMPAARN